jgi:hypothetical protein
MSSQIKTQRRWLKSAIMAAAQEEIRLPWATNRLARRSHIQPKTLASTLALAPAKYTAVAAH